MSISVNGIIPNDFTEINNKEKAMSELSRLRDKMQSYFHVTGGFPDYSYDCENSEFGGSNEYRIITPFEGIHLELHNGFIAIITGYNYTQYFYTVKGIAWLRCMFFDIAQSLGAKWMYVAWENCCDNTSYDDVCSYEWDDYEFSFDMWKTKYHDIPLIEEEFFKDFDERNLIPWDDLNGIHIDYFEGIYQRKNYLESIFPCYEILTTQNIGRYFILGKKDNEIFLLNETTQKPLRCGHIDAIEEDFLGRGFVIVKKNKRAFFDNNGKRKTPYRMWEFYWEHDTKTDTYWLINYKTKERICEISY